MSVSLGRCKFDKAWVGACGKPTLGASDMCEEHAFVECCSCGKPAIKSCEHTGGPVVCGANLCADCGHLPPKEDEGVFSGGYHGPLEGTKGLWSAHFKRVEDEFKRQEIESKRREVAEYDAKMAATPVTED